MFKEAYLFFFKLLICSLLRISGLAPFFISSLEGMRTILLAGILFLFSVATVFLIDINSISKWVNKEVRNKNS